MVHYFSLRSLARKPEHYYNWFEKKERKKKKKKEKKKDK